jgi:hypothetical protein
VKPPHSLAASLSAARQRRAGTTRVAACLIAMLLLRVFLTLCLSAVAIPVRAQPSGDLGWSVITNRSGASVDFPGGLFTKEATPTAPSRAIAYSTADGRARFELFSSPNTRGESPAQFARRNGAGRDRLDYKRITGNFIAASAVNRGLILYRRCNFTGGMIHCIDVRYPASEKRAWDGIVTRISLSLKAR